MSQEIRRVKPDWKHPKKGRHYIPLFNWENYKTDLLNYSKSLVEYYALNQDVSTGEEYWQQDGFPPNPENYMPLWAPEEATHLQVYETNSEGTPLSPVCKNMGELKSWFAQNGYIGAADVMIRRFLSKIEER